MSSVLHSNAQCYDLTISTGDSRGLRSVVGSLHSRHAASVWGGQERHSLGGISSQRLFILCRSVH